MKHIPLKQKYADMKPKFLEEFGLKNLMALPKITKIVVNMGTGERLRDKGMKEKLIADMTAVAGQKPKIQAAKMSVSGFGVREGMPVGLTVTLRKDKMYNFLDKLMNIVLPRFRDFRGVSSQSFDKAGNYTLGVGEHTVFPEVDLANVDRPHGLEITIVIRNSSPEKSKVLLQMLGMPFEKEN